MTCDYYLPGRICALTERRLKNVSLGEPCNRQRVCQTHQLTRDAESVNSRRRSFLGLLPPVFTAWAYNLGLSARAKRALAPHPKERLGRQYGSRFPSQNLPLSISTPRHGVSAGHGRQGMAESGEHRRFGRADEPADGTRWNQMEPNGTVYDDVALLFCEQTYRIDARFVGYPPVHARFDRRARPLLRPHQSAHDLASRRPSAQPDCRFRPRTLALGADGIKPDGSAFRPPGPACVGAWPCLGRPIPTGRPGRAVGQRRRSIGQT